MPPLDHGTPGGDSWAKLCLVLGVSLRNPGIVSSTGDANPCVCSRGAWSPRLDWREGRAAEGRSLGKFVHTFCILYFIFCIVFVFSISTGPAHCARVCGRTCGRIDLCSLPWQVCTYILYSVFHILYCICIFYLNGPSPLCPRLWNILSILCSNVTWRASLRRFHLL